MHNFLMKSAGKRAGPLAACLGRYQAGGQGGVVRRVPVRGAAVAGGIAKWTWQRYSASERLAVSSC
jgi:hypothetical protein